MLIDDYFRQFSEIIDKTYTIQSSRITFDKRNLFVGFIRGSIWFLDGSVLHLREFVDVQQIIDRYMYVYQYQKSSGQIIFRYDNTPHFPNLASFPHHKHDGDERNVTEAAPQHLRMVLDEIQHLIIFDANIIKYIYILRFF